MPTAALFFATRMTVKLHGRETERGGNGDLAEEPETAQQRGILVLLRALEDNTSGRFAKQTSTR